MLQNLGSSKLHSHQQSPAFCCRLTKQVSAFYDDVLRLLTNPPLNQHFDKSWTSHVQVKTTLYDVESQLQQAAQLHKDDDIAPEIARLKVIQFCTSYVQSENRSLQSIVRSNKVAMMLQNQDVPLALP